jgi:hypothetical protein
MTDKLLIERELLERELLSVLDFSESNLRRVVDHLIDVGYTRAAPRQPEGDAHKNEAQPEVAQNTGSRSMTNKLSSQGCTGCTGVEGVAAPCETPDAVDIFAWATFDGEGSYDLRLYEDNEGYRDDFRDANPLLHPDWVFPLCRLSDAQRAIAELREECERLRVKLMTIASAEPGRHNIEWAKAMAATGNNEAYAKWREAFDQRDKLAGLLGECRGMVAHEVERWKRAAEILPVNARVESGLLTRIDAALTEVPK